MTEVNEQGVTHEFIDGPIHARAYPGQCVIIEANDSETGDYAEVRLSMNEARALALWINRVIGAPDVGDKP